MKALKIFAWALGALLALAAIAAGLSLNSTVQTWAVRRIAAGMPGLQFSVGRVAAGLSHATVENLSVTQDGKRCSVASVSADYSAWDYLLHRRVIVGNVEAKGVVLDLPAAQASSASAQVPATVPPAPAQSRVAPRSTPASAQPSAFDGLLGAAVVPVDLHLARASVEGRAIIAGQATVVFKVQARNLATGGSGSVRWTADATGFAPSLPLRSGHSEGTLSLTLTADGKVTSAGLDAETALDARDLPASRIRVRLTAAREGAEPRETYSLSVDDLSGAAARRMAELQGGWQASTGRIQGTWTLGVAGATVEAVAAALRLPEVAVDGRGRFDLSPSGDSASVVGTLDCRGSRLERLSSALAGLEGLRLAVNFDARLADQTARVEQLSVVASEANGREIARVQAVQPVAYSLKEGKVQLADPGRELAAVSLRDVPLAWAQPLLQDVHVDSGSLSLGLGVTASPDGAQVKVATSEPIVIRDLSLRKDGRSLVDGLGLSADFGASGGPQSLDYRVRRLELRSRDGVLATLEVAGTAQLGAKLQASAKGRLSADLAGLLKQPVAAGSATLSAGRLEGAFDARLADELQASVKASVRQLRAAADGQTLGDIDLSFDATLPKQGTAKVEVPFTLTNGARRTDVRLEGTLGQGSSGLSFDGSLASSKVYVDDLLALAALAPAGTSGPVQPSPATAPAATTAPDKQPVWAGNSGKLRIRFDQIIYGQGATVANVNGIATASADKLGLDSLEGQLNGKPFKVAATLGFDAKQPEVYGLNASVNLDGFDVGAFLRAANPNEPPPVETTVSLNALAEGRAGTLGELPMALTGKVDLTGSAGVLRALQRKGGNAVNAIASVAGFLGALRGNQDTVAVADLAKKLAQLPFDKVTLHAERGADLTIKVTQLEFLSPDTRLTGSGQLTHKDGVSLLNQPMSFKLQLAGKDQMAYLMDRAKLLNGQQDDQGFYTMSTTFTLGGTPAKPDSGDLWRIIGSAALSSAAGVLEKLLNR